MDIVSALTPPFVMAVAFTVLIVTIVKNQGGANKAEEDAALDAAEARQREGGGVSAQHHG
jgi:hypothetical protein